MWLLSRPEPVQSPGLAIFVYEYRKECDGQPPFPGWVTAMLGCFRLALLPAPTRLCHTSHIKERPTNDYGFIPWKAAPRFKQCLDNSTPLNKHHSNSNIIYTFHITHSTNTYFDTRANNGDIPVYPIHAHKPIWLRMERNCLATKSFTHSFIQSSIHSNVHRHHVHWCLFRSLLQEGLQVSATRCADADFDLI